MKSIKLSIKKWDKHNPRKDYIHPRWFALNNRILEDPDFFEFNELEFKAWIYILCQASQKASGEITLNFNHADRICLIKEKVLLSCIKKLQEKQIVEVVDLATVVPRTDYVQTTVSTIQYNTEQTEQYNIVGPSDLDLLYEEIYSIYPRKEGKKLGLAKLKKQLKADRVKIANCKTSTQNYANHCRKNKIEPQFIKLFSTFVGSWEDWLDKNTGTTNGYVDQRNAFKPFVFEPDPRDLE